LIRCEVHRLFSTWESISDFGDGNEKANFIKNYAHTFSQDCVWRAYQCALQMPVTYRIRALAGIYSRMDEPSKESIFSYLCDQLVQGAAEAAYQLKLLFPGLDARRRADLVALHLSMANLHESYLAFFVIRNAAYMDDRSAKNMAEKVRGFQSDYFMNRCMLKLAQHLPSGEIDRLYERFMDTLQTSPPTFELIHNLFHFSAVRRALNKGAVIDLALEKIALLDDTDNALYQQEKCHLMFFLVHHLEEKDREKAFAIAATVRGGYRRQMIGKLNRHFSKRANYCALRGAPICY
jgi:hypothetical protein